jgi:hypothetical protein
VILKVQPKEMKVDALAKVKMESDALHSLLCKTAQERLFNVVEHA